ncbi:MAG TPA: hypothetical protein VF498_11630 [Anaerolineales bacterium]
MGLLKKLSNLFAAPERSAGYGYWISVKCNRCGEVIRSRIDLRNDLSLNYEEGEAPFFCRKTLIGSQHCYQPIEVELKFDSNRKLIDREAQAGQFVDEP